MSHLIDNKSKKIFTNKQGYMAILSIIVIFAIVVSVSMILATLTVSEGYMSLDSKNSYDANYLLNSCMEESLLRLNLDGVLPASVSIPPETICQLEIEDINSTQYTYKISIVHKDFFKAIRVVAIRTDRVYIDSYEEVDY